MSLLLDHWHLVMIDFVDALSGFVAALFDFFFNDIDIGWLLVEDRMFFQWFNCAQTFLQLAIRDAFVKTIVDVFVALHSSFT